MKKVYNLIVLASFVSLSSCFSLDQEPYDSASDQTLIATVRDAQLAVNGIYASFRNIQEGEGMYATDVQADFLNAALNYPEKMPNLHRWSDFSTSNDDTGSIWRNYFYIIQNVNVYLEAFDKVPNEAALDVLRGELYLSRAFCYSYLATHYCEAYNTANADNQLGMSLLTHKTVKDFPARSSLKETYEFILADIARAETLLASKAGQEGAETFTLDAVKALKARVLLYQNNWSEAYNVAKALVDAGTYPLQNSASALNEIWANDDVAEAIVQLNASVDNGSVELPLSKNDIYLGKNGSNYSPYYIPTQDFVNLFDANDIRKEVFLSQLSVGGQNVYLVNKYPDNQNLAPVFGFPYYGHKPKPFRIPEMYLIAAEAAYRNGDATNAQQYLNALRTARGLTAVTATGDALFTEIQNERNRELCFEGFRLIDIKRWGLGVVRGTPQNNDVIITTNPTEYYQLNIAAGAGLYYKIVWPIPQINIQIEKGKLKQNPNW